MITVSGDKRFQGSKEFKGSKGSTGALPPPPLASGVRANFRENAIRGPNSRPMGVLEAGERFLLGSAESVGEFCPNIPSKTREGRGWQLA